MVSREPHTDPGGQRRKFSPFHRSANTALERLGNSQVIHRVYSTDIYSGSTMCQGHLSLPESLGNKRAHKSLMEEKDIKPMYKQLEQVKTPQEERAGLREIIGTGEWACLGGPVVKNPPLKKKRESTLQCKGPGFDPWPRKIPHAAGQLSLNATSTEAHVP